MVINVIIIIIIVTKTNDTKYDSYVLLQNSKQLST